MSKETLLGRERGAQYFVAFQDKKSGVITWTCYPTREEFEADRARAEGRKKVIAQGISEAECIELGRSTPMSAYRKEALLSATGRNGFDSEHYRFKLEGLELMRELGMISNDD